MVDWLELDATTATKGDVMSQIIRTITCKCGKKVVCIGATNTCDSCFISYNWLGKEITDPEQWGDTEPEDTVPIPNKGYMQ